MKMKKKILGLLGIAVLAVCLTACKNTDTAGEHTVPATEALPTETTAAEEESTQNVSEEPKTEETAAENTPEQIRQEAIEQAKAFFAAKQYDEVKAQSVGKALFNGWVRMYNLYLSDGEVCNYTWKAGVTVDDICSQGLYAYSDAKYINEDGISIDTYKVSSYEPEESCIVYFREMSTDETQGYVLAANLTGSVCDVDGLTIVGIRSNYSAITENMDGRSMGKIKAEPYFANNYESMTEYTCVVEGEYATGDIFHFFDMGEGAWWIVKEYDDGWIGGEGIYLLADYAEEVIERWGHLARTPNAKEYFFDTLLQ